MDVIAGNKSSHGGLGIGQRPDRASADLLERAIGKRSQDETVERIVSVAGRVPIAVGLGDQPRVTVPSLGSVDGSAGIEEARYLDGPVEAVESPGDLVLVRVGLQDAVVAGIVGGLFDVSDVINLQYRPV